MLSIAVIGKFQDDNLGVVEDEGSGFFLLIWVRLPRHILSYPPPQKKMKSSEVINFLSYITGNVLNC